MLVRSWNDFNEKIKAVSRRSDLNNSPYRYFTKGDTDKICILKGNGDILTSYTYSTDVLDQKAEIETMAIPDQELLVYYGDKKPEVIVNLTTGKGIGSFSFIPPIYIERGYVLAYGKDRKLIRIAVEGGLLNSLYIEQDSHQFFAGEGGCNKNLFFDLKFYLEGRSMASAVEFECVPEPEAINVEDYPQGKQIERVQKMLCNIENDHLFEPLDDEILLSELLVMGRVPRVDTITPVVLDTDVKTTYGIDSINVIPGGRLNVHILASFWKNYDRKDYNTLFKHDVFTISYTVI